MTDPRIITSDTNSPIPSDDYLFVPDLQALRAKIARGRGMVGYLWRNIQALPNADSNGRYYPAFRYLITGEEEYAQQALQEIKQAMEFYRAGDFSMDVHFHTWCNSAPMARLAIMFDWIADSPQVSAADASEIKEAMLDYTLKHPYNIAKSRVLTFDNQISAMSFCCALVGYLFGIKRGKDLRAQRLLNAGIMRFPDIFALSPAGGYSYEGSTYFCQIVAPIVSWYCALMEQITGEEIVTHPFPPSNVTPEEILRTYHRIIGPSGLMPPWDHYGWMRCASTMGLAYLSRKTGDPTPLATIERLGLGAEPGYIAWGSDDKMWTLLWWPDEIEPAGDFDRAWAIPNVGGALVEPRKAWRLFQAWDECSPGVYCGRAQVNPNMLTLDCWGSPIFTDGIPTVDGCPLFDYPLDAFRNVLGEGELDSIANYYRTFIPNWQPQQFVKGFGYGCLGGSNSIVINDEGFYTPTTPREGRLTAFANLPQVQCLAAEVADYYRPHYPIETMVRTSLLVRDVYYLVRDTIRTCGTSLRFDWQVFTRGTVTSEGQNAHIATPEGVQVAILPLNPEARLEVTEVPNFPRGIENHSTRIRYRVDGANVDLPFLIIPRRPMATLADLREGWTAVRMSQHDGEVLGLPAGVINGELVSAQEIGLQPGDGNDGWVWASREFTVETGQQLYLHVASRVHGLHVWVNGQPATLPDADLPDGGGTWYLPAIVEITKLAHSGSNTLVLAGLTCQGKLVNGAVELMAGVELPALPKVTVANRGHYLIDGPQGHDEIYLSDNGVITTDTLSAQAQAVVLTAEGTMALQATSVISGALRVWSDRPQDIAVCHDTVTISDLTGPENVEVTNSKYHLWLQSRGALDVDLIGQVRLITHLDDDKLIFINGVHSTIKRHPFTGQLKIVAPTTAPATDPSMPSYVARMEELMRCASAGDRSALPALLQGLQDADWKVQQIAAELLGRQDYPSAVAPLLAQLARETPENIYSEDLPAWDEASRRYALEPEMWETGPGSSPDFVKRHRLKVIIIEALGRLRAREAVSALCAIVEDQREFYPVHSVACQALGRIGDLAALPALERATHYPEVNTKYRAQDAISRLTTGHPRHPDYPDKSGM